MFDLYAETTRNHLIRDGKTIQIFEPDLTPLQRKVLELLAIPQNAYLTATSKPERTLTRSPWGEISTPRSAERESYRRAVVQAPR